MLKQDLPIKSQLRLTSVDISYIINLVTTLTRSPVSVSLDRRCRAGESAKR
jgi:hypothetical protein